MDINELQTVEFPQNDSWVVTFNKLCDLSPDAADKVTGLTDGVTIWDIYFVQDLFQAVNEHRMQLLDIGWYPDGAPSGHFRLLLVEKNSSNSEYDWIQPVLQYETRSIDELLVKLRELMSNTNLGGRYL